MTGITTALNRFISRSADQCKPFFQLLHKWKDYSWTEECDQAFRELKEYLSNPPVLSCPRQEEILYAYLAVTNHAVNLILIRVDFRVQRPIYYVSKSLQDAATRYFHVEKDILTLVHATRKLSYYFQAHTVMVLTQLPLQTILQKSDYFGRVVQWGTMLGAFDIKY